MTDHSGKVNAEVALPFIWDMRADFARLKRPVNPYTIIPGHVLCNCTATDRVFI